MWPFSRRTSELIDDSWLSKKGIDPEYRNAFGRKPSEIKSEIKRNSKNLADEREKLTALEADQRSMNLEMESKLSKQADLKKKKGAERDRNLQIITGEIEAISIDLDRIGEEKIQALGRISNLNETVKMLQVIKSKRYKTPAQLTQATIWGTGDRVANLRDTLPRLNEVDNSDIIRDYAEEE